jgi:hypothetical protein
MRRVNIRVQQSGVSLGAQFSALKPQKTNKLIPAITINAGAETMISNQLPQFSCVQAFMDFQLCLALHHPKPLFILPAAIPHRYVFLNVRSNAHS